MDDIEEAGNGRNDCVTAMEIKRETSIVLDTVKMVEDAESTDCVVTVTEVNAPVDEEEEAFWDAVESVSDGESEESVDEKESTEALLTTVAVTIEPTVTSRGIWFPRLRHEHHLGAEPPLKSALRKPLAPSVYDPEETVVKVVAQGIVDEAVVGEVATVPDHGEVVGDLSLADGTSEAKYSRLFTDSELEAITSGNELEPKRQMKVNADASKDPALEDMAKYLGIPEEVLE
ncbi:hypothetical protein PInf_022885 [Phytophthora infestans]|nr:hypothetical protein PInf_022885 [Phytophthora infestans]